MKPFFERYRDFNDSVLRRQASPELPFIEPPLNEEERALVQKCAAYAALRTTSELCLELVQWRLAQKGPPS